MLEIEKKSELFGDVLAGHDVNLIGNPPESEEHQGELDNAAALHDSEAMADPVRCQMRQWLSDEPSTACRRHAGSPGFPGSFHLDRFPPQPPLSMHFFVYF